MESEKHKQELGQLLSASEHKLTDSGIGLDQLKDDDAENDDAIELLGEEYPYCVLYCLSFEECDSFWYSYMKEINWLMQVKQTNNKFIINMFRDFSFSGLKINSVWLTM